MRIIGGRLRGRKIMFPKKKDVRPTKDRIRESVFNMIAERVPGAKVLDLFAGSGAYGLEALSRGAATAVFVDNDPECLDVIEDNAQHLGIREDMETVRGNIPECLEQLGNKNEKYDIVFADPPFNRGLAKKTLQYIYQYDILSRLGVLILEHAALESVRGASVDVNIFKEKTYKDITITILGDGR